jgi:hypothetical protein
LRRVIVKGKRGGKGTETQEGEEVLIDEDDFDDEAVEAPSRPGSAAAMSLSSSTDGAEKVIISHHHAPQVWQSTIVLQGWAHARYNVCKVAFDPCLGHSSAVTDSAFSLYCSHGRRCVCANAYRQASTSLSSSLSGSGAKSKKNPAPHKVKVAPELAALTTLGGVKFKGWDQAKLYQADEMRYCI